MAAKKKATPSPARKPERTGPVARFRFEDNRTGRHSLLGIDRDGVYEVTSDTLAYAESLVLAKLGEILTDQSTDQPAAPAPPQE